ncbi:L-rhamnose-binding lectin CSL3-like [Aulostomus maculatus]
MLSAGLTTIAFLAASCFGTTYAQETPTNFLYVVSCKEHNIELTCPPGHSIEVHQLDYGLSSPEICAARDQPVASVSENDCIHPFMMPWVKASCDLYEHCRLATPDPQMFTCDQDIDSFIQVKYTCALRDPSIHRAVICDGDDEEFECENEEVLKILKANYGRLNAAECIMTGQTSNMTYCTSEAVDGLVKKWCDGKAECSLPVSPDFLGTPEYCDDHPKYLIVDYTCEILVSPPGEAGAGAGAGTETAAAAGAEEEEEEAAA